MNYLDNNTSIDNELFILGFNWEEQSRNQTILINTPQMKSAAGMITLGLMCRDLCDPKKNDRAEHFNELYSNAVAYLNQCKNCNFACNPDLAECGRTSKAKNELKNTKESKVYRLESASSREICVSYSNKATKKTPFPSTTVRKIQQNYSENWHFKEQSQLLFDFDNALSYELYNKLTKGKVCSDNLTFSYSGLVYIGCNKMASERLIDSISLKVNDKEYSLYNLLALNKLVTARLRYISALTLKGLDGHIKPKTAVFEDIYSFKLIDHNFFQNIPKFIIVNSEESDQKLESLYDYYSTNRQWFSINEELTKSKNSQLTTKGLSVLVLNET
ncbi:hypothetical protein Q4575_09105 [Psychrosphaera sp. 1_MG-2023]|uniref:hypothetical protein n=1 Tax=Psychrosphaera sp. 1_MG-2023 TaxID=3062643 RepID=UPI0026E431B6|nr:hypothetical protein [Psychrosphaera sp. 1_MG-2023]MDO6719557.1 hypothetical protein [Psychrosphaera sp. 1_MG-2023]